MPHSDRGIAVALAAVAFVVYMANGRLIVEGDTVPARYIPLALIRDRTVVLDRWAALVQRVPPGRPYATPYWLMRSRSGHLVSTYPIVTPLLASPVFAAAAVAGWLPSEPEALAHRAEQLEKIAASLMAALSVMLLYRLLRRRCSPPASILLSVAYAFGTATWAIGSQALWQHGTAELLLAAGLLAATAERGIAGPIVAGAAAGLLAFNRPPDGVFSAAIVAFLFLRGRKRGALALAAAIALAAPFLLYNVATFGALTGGYGALGLAGPHAFYSHPVAEGIAGLLVSPAKGLFVFSIFFVFLVVRLRRGATDLSHGRLDALLAAAIAAQIVFYARADWRAGACYGTRYLSDALPALVFLLAPAVQAMSGRVRLLLAATVVVSIAIEAVGALCYPRGGSDELYYPAGRSRLSIPRAVWLPRNAAFWIEAHGGIAPPELFSTVRNRR